MKTCGDLETSGMVRITTTRSAVIASPDRWIAGVHAAALRFVVWEPHQVRSGWLGGALTLAHATSRSVIPLAGLALDGGEWSPHPGPSALHELTRAPDHAVVVTCALRYGDLVTLHGSAGRVGRLTPRAMETVLERSMVGGDDSRWPPARSGLGQRLALGAVAIRECARHTRAE